MNNRERLKLIIENWFVEKTSIKPTEGGLNNLVDRTYYNKQLNICGVVSKSCDMSETELKNRIRLADIVYHQKKESS